MSEATLQDIGAQSFDVIIIGAGMGGGLLGRRLTEQGLSVLFVEKGDAGHPMEGQVSLGEIHPPKARLLRGLWPKPAEARLGGVPTRFFGPYGAGVGGSSVFYAAALEQPERHDLDDDPDRPHPLGGWPVGFDAFKPYFDQASDLLHLCGTPDPLSADPIPDLPAPPPMSGADQALMRDMQAGGLHPYRLHLAVRYPDRCRACFGSKCPWGCKMDGRSAGVAPALATSRAQILTGCEVREVLEDGTKVTGLRVRDRAGQEAVLTAQRYALCAGSLGSARLLLASNGRRAEGAANSSDWVGRGLMFHLNEIFALWPKRKLADGESFGKAISLRDLYTAEGQRFGLVQSMGMDVSYGNIVHYMGQIYDQSILRRFRKPRELLRIPALIAARLFGKAAVFVGMMEDFPYAENRVVLNAEDPEILTFEYTFHKELLARRKAFRRAILRAFRGQRRFLVSVQPVLNYGHPVGTLRFGTNPGTSVLDPDCRSHDLRNLFVGDASFMPSALGVNPSLTIAANALRVGDLIAQDLASDKAPENTSDRTEKDDAA